MGTKAGSVTAWADGKPRPALRSFDYPKGGAASRLSLVPVGPTGKIRIANRGTGSVQADGHVVGHYVSGKVTQPGGLTVTGAKSLPATKIPVRSSRGGAISGVAMLSAPPI